MYAMANHKPLSPKPQNPKPLTPYNKKLDCPSRIAVGQFVVSYCVCRFGAGEGGPVGYGIVLGI